MELGVYLPNPTTPMIFQTKITAAPNASATEILVADGPGGVPRNPHIPPHGGGISPTFTDDADGVVDEKGIGVLLPDTPRPPQRKISVAPIENTAWIFPVKGLVGFLPNQPRTTQ